jgi:hypothetical protein
MGSRYQRLGRSCSRPVQQIAADVVPAAAKADELDTAIEVAKGEKKKPQRKAA